MPRFTLTVSTLMEVTQTKVIDKSDDCSITTKNTQEQGDEHTEDEEFEVLGGDQDEVEVRGVDQDEVKERGGDHADDQLEQGVERSEDEEFEVRGGDQDEASKNKIQKIKSSIL